MIEGMMMGINTAFSGYNILMVMLGCFAGTIIGMLPGLGPMSAIALMIPITYGFFSSFSDDINGWGILWRHLWWFYIIDSD